VTWWLGDAVGALVVAPFALLWLARPLEPWPKERLLELFALAASVMATGALVFGGFFPSEVQNYPLEFLCLPPLLWAAIRFGPRETTSAVLLLSGAAVVGTLVGFGPFVRPSRTESLFLVQAYAGVASITTLTLAAISSERFALEMRLRDLAVTDPLTGIANYRLLTERLEAEIARAQRTGRPFSVLLLDVNELKKINDRFGHLVGSRALCRVADVLRNCCRGTDTPARYGGDEFAIVLPEADVAAAQQIASRVLGRMASDGETPPVTVSLGAATYPEHGESTEELLAAADRMLYEMKRESKKKSPAMSE
jgi:diguanylate cyclase (GGDEF)-like protein